MSHITKLTEKIIIKAHCYVKWAYFFFISFFGMTRNEHRIKTKICMQYLRVSHHWKKNDPDYEGWLHSKNFLEFDERLIHNKINRIFKKKREKKLKASLHIEAMNRKEI